MVDIIICKNCVMDTTDPSISFDESGVCSYCRSYEVDVRRRFGDKARNEIELQKILTNIKLSHNKSKFDCIIGLSGGVDSSYLALKCYDWGLNPLVVHVDAGWNTAAAVANINAIINYTGFQLYTKVIDWDEMRRLQVAYMRAGVPHQDVPQDHIFAATLYHFAIENNIKIMLSGGNLTTEYVLPSSWQWSAVDAINLHDIFRQFGKGKLKNYKTISVWQYYLTYPFLYKFRTFRPLNYIDYNKITAEQELVERIGYKTYQRKHGESLFTKFFQNYYLPERYGFDKRIAHYSSMILSGFMTRDRAMQLLKEPLYDNVELIADKKFVADKLDIPYDEFEQLLTLPNRTHSTFRNWKAIHRKLKKIQLFVEKIIGKKIGIYS